LRFKEKIMASAPNILIAPRNQNPRYGFKVAGLSLVPAESVLTEVIADARVFPVPKSAAALAGVVNLRGTIVPVFDPAALGNSVNTLRPSQQRALVFDREESRVGLLINDDPVLVPLVSASEKSTRPDSPLSRFLIKPWVQENAPEMIWWEFDHHAAFQFLARPA
jgi:CheW-like domain